jgi:hypothetical protein
MKCQTHVDFGPKKLALVTDTSIPFLQVTQRQARVLLNERVEIFVLVDKVPSITVLHCSVLGRTRWATRASRSRSQ